MDPPSCTSYVHNIIKEIGLAARCIIDSFGMGGSHVAFAGLSRSLLDVGVELAYVSREPSSEALTAGQMDILCLLWPAFGEMPLDSRDVLGIELLCLANRFEYHSIVDGFILVDEPITQAGGWRQRNGEVLRQNSQFSQ